jgi:hypothetical protein
MARSGKALRVLSPLVWLLAVDWLAGRAIARGFIGGLRAWDAVSAAAGRALAGLGATALRALGPPGRALRRWLTPLFRGARWLWRRTCLRALLFLSRPLGRLGRWVLARSVRAGQWLRRKAVRLAGRLRPLSRAVTSAARPLARALRAGRRAVSRRALRLGAALGSAWGGGGQGPRASGALESKTNRRANTT